VCVCAPQREMTKNKNKQKKSTDKDKDKTKAKQRGAVPQMSEYDEADELAALAEPGNAFSHGMALTMSFGCDDDDVALCSARW
jgi:hypothetical protein